MKVLLHIGPHKTGTTSLQEVLRLRFSSPEPTPVWYPPDGIAHGYGHADLAWQTLGLYGFEASTEPLRALAERAARGGCERMILSSEEFCYGYPDGFAAMASVLAGHEVEVVVTLSPYARRAASLWQEKLKHGHCDGIEGYIERVLGSPGFQAGLFPLLCRTFPDTCHTLIVVDPAGAPGTLFQQFADVAGFDLLLEAELAQAPRRNRSLSRIEAEILRGVNQGFRHAGLSEPPTPARRACIDALLRLFLTPEWIEAAPPAPIVPPEEWLPRLEARTSECLAAIRALEAAGRLRILGDLDSLCP